MADIAQFKPRDVNAEPVEAVVDYLEQALALAKTGEMREVLIFGSLIGGEMFRAARYDNAPEMIGRLELLKDSVIRGLNPGSV